MTQPHVEVDVQDVRRAARLLKAELKKALKRGLRKGIEREAVPEFRSRFPRRTGRGAKTARAQVTKYGAALVAGGQKGWAPYVRWVDMGGVVRHMGRNHHHDNEHLLRREVVREGRYSTPSVRERQVAIAHHADAEIDKVTERM